MATTITKAPVKRAGSTRRVIQVSVREGALFRAPAASGQIQVISGTAWLTRGAADEILSAGQTAPFAARGIPVIVSALGGELVKLEVELPGGGKVEQQVTGLIKESAACQA